MAARVAAEHEEERKRGGDYSTTSHGRSTNDPNLLAKLSGEGWLEHTTEGG